MDYANDFLVQYLEKSKLYCKNYGIQCRTYKSSCCGRPKYILVVSYAKQKQTKQSFETPVVSILKSDCLWPNMCYAVKVHDIW